MSSTVHGKRRSVTVAPCDLSDHIPVQFDMPKYRLYVYDAEDRLIAPAMLIAADNDEAATEQAENMLDGVRADLKDEDRLVMRFPKE